jgi:hypothetical protein
VNSEKVFSLAILGLGFNSKKESKLDNNLKGKMELIMQGFFGIIVEMVLNSC